MAIRFSSEPISMQQCDRHRAQRYPANSSISSRTGPAVPTPVMALAGILRDVH